MSHSANKPDMNENFVSTIRLPELKRRRSDHSKTPALLSLSWSSLLSFSLLVLFPSLMMKGDRVHVQAQYTEDEETGLLKTEHSLLREGLEMDFLGLLRAASADKDDSTTTSAPTDDNPREAARLVLQSMTMSLEDRLAHLFTKAKTRECRAKIAQHVSYFVNAIGKEEALPFSQTRFTNECPDPVYDDWENLPEGMHIGHVQNRTYQPPRNNNNNESIYIDDPAELKFCYGILTHDSAASTERLIQVLYEPGHFFVVHVDGKETSDATYQQLVEFAKTRPYVHILDPTRRVRINWGGFSMVNATLQMLKYAFAIDTDDIVDHDKPLEFHKFIHVASTSYPIASNRQIRHRIADYPLDANFLHVILKPNRPATQHWFYFVECDDALHRIYRLPSLSNFTAGAELYTSSQWFILSRDFAQYLAEAKPGTFVHQFLEYTEHVVVSDESFFGTVLRHTPYCTKHHNDNFLHLQFDRWESDLPAGKRDEKKCMMLDPDHCGRSPTTMTVDYADILELSTDLFARKFVDSTDSRVKDIVDQWREKRETDDPAVAATLLGEHGLDFEGHGVLIVAKDTVGDWPLCLGLGETGNTPKLVSCFHEAIVPTLSQNWETGGVIVAETLPHNRWTVGPCTNDGHLERLPSAEIIATAGNYSVMGPRCMLKQMDGPRQGRCLHTDSENLQPGGETRVFPCLNRWYQFFSFGNGREAPARSIVATIPSPVVRQIHNLGHEQSPYMCLGVWGRGNRDEVDWDDESEQEGGFENATVNDESNFRNESLGDDENVEWETLSSWFEQELVTTQCTNEGAVIEWLFVPFIVEDENDEDSSSPSPKNGQDADAAESSSQLDEEISNANQSDPSVVGFTTEESCDETSGDTCQHSSDGTGEL